MTIMRGRHIPRGTTPALPRRRKADRDTFAAEKPGHEGASLA